MAKLSLEIGLKGAEKMASEIGKAFKKAGLDKFFDAKALDKLGASLEKLFKGFGSGDNKKTENALDGMLLALGDVLKSINVLTAIVSAGLLYVAVGVVDGLKPIIDMLKFVGTLLVYPFAAILMPLLMFALKFIIFSIVFTIKLLAAFLTAIKQLLSGDIKGANETAEDFFKEVKNSAFVKGMDELLYALLNSGGNAAAGTPGAAGAPGAAGTPGAPKLPNIPGLDFSIFITNLLGAQTAVKNFQDKFPKIPDDMANFGQKLSNKITEEINKIKISEETKKSFGDILTTATDVAFALSNPFSWAIKYMITNLPTWMSKLAEMGKTIYKHITDNLVSWMSGLAKIGKAFYDAAKDILNVAVDLAKRVINGDVALQGQAVNFVGGALNNLMKFVKGGDFVVTPSGIIETSPQDYIFGMKSPGGAGNITLNVNMYDTRVSDDMDIDKLAEKIGRTIELNLKRAGNYGSR